MKGCLDRFLELRARIRQVLRERTTEHLPGEVGTGRCLPEQHRAPAPKWAAKPPRLHTPTKRAPDWPAAPFPHPPTHTPSTPHGSTAHKKLFPQIQLRLIENLPPRPASEPQTTPAAPANTSHPAKMPREISDIKQVRFQTTWIFFSQAAGSLDEHFSDVGGGLVH